MLTIIFMAALVYVAIRMLIWGISAAWSIAKIIAFVVLLPLLILGLMEYGLFLIALSLLVVSVIVSTVGALVGV